MSFYRERAIKAVRKARGCTGCNHKIEVGESALECSGKQDDFWSGTYHHDCRNAEIALNKLHDVWGDDDWMNLGSDLEWDYWPWLIEAFPTVAARMNITTERFNDIRDEQERCRNAFAARKATVAPTQSPNTQVKP